MSTVKQISDGVKRVLDKHPSKICVHRYDRFYQVLLERCIEQGYLEDGLADIYKDGDLYIDFGTYHEEYQRALYLYGDKS